MREKQTCRSCGTRPDEWNPERGGDRNAYAVALGRCRGCEVMGAERTKHQDTQLGGGVYVHLQKRR